MSKETLPKVRIYSDGSSKGTSDSPGGYGTIVQFMTDDNKTEKIMEYTEGFKVTTNNRMELMGVICGLESLTQPSEVMIYSDSKYVVDAFNHYWVNNWQANGWLTATKQPVKNIDLWQRLIAAKKPHKCKFAWVKGHDGHPDNERCDYLASSSSNGVLFERGKDGKLYEVNSKLKADSGLKVSDTEEPKLTLAEITKEYIQQIGKDIKDYTVTVNGAKFILDEEGNLAPHPNEDKEKCKKVFETLKKFEKDDKSLNAFRSIMSVGNTDFTFLDKIFDSFFTTSKTIPVFSIEKSSDK